MKTKRVIILFFVGSFGQSIMALVVSPGEVINYILTWNFFHLFGFTTLVFLVVFEVVWWLEKQGYNSQKILVSILTGILVILLVTFIIFHDYWDPVTAQHVILSAKLDLVDIIEHALIDYGTTPIIPWFSFGLMGGCVEKVPSLYGNNMYILTYTDARLKQPFSKHILCHHLGNNFS